MIRKLGASCALFLCLAGCGPDVPATLGEMAAANDPKLCAAPGLADHVFARINPSYGEYIAQGNEGIETMITATGIDESIHRVSCLAHALVEGENYRAQLEVGYAVTPDLSSQDDVMIEIDQSPGDFYVLKAFLDESGYGKTAMGETGSKAQPAPSDPAAADLADLWSSETVSGACNVYNGGSLVFSAACSGKGHGDSIFVTSQADGCSVELNKGKRSVTGSVFAYRDICPGLGEDDTTPVDLGEFEISGDCFESGQTSICLDPQ